MSPQRTWWSKEGRRRILDEYARLERDLNGLEKHFNQAEGFELERLGEHQRTLTDRMRELWQQYQEGVPSVPLSRCPLTRLVVSHSIDFIGLDGLWWRYFGPARPAEDVPPTLFGFTGAVGVRGTPEHTSFLVRIGPGVPYVIPRLFADPSVVAVVSAVPIGSHAGCAILYYAPRRPDASGVNDWGTNEYQTPLGWDDVEEPASGLDFQLAPWISQGRLRWIAPDDKSLALRDTAPGCPYLDLPGPRDIGRLQFGQIWRESE